MFKTYFYLAYAILFGSFYFFLMYKTIRHYQRRVIKICTNFPLNVVIGLITILIQIFVNAFIARKLQSIFYINASMLPHTTALLTFIISALFWLVVVGIVFYFVYLYLIAKYKKFYLRHIGIMVISLIAFCAGWGLISRFNKAPEFIKKVAVYMDYVNTNSMPKICSRAKSYSNILIIDTNNISVVSYDPTNKQIVFKIIKC